MLAWALGAGAVGTLATAIWGAWWRNYARGLAKDLSLATAQARDAVRQYQDEKERHVGSIKRLEKVVAFLNSELREADDQLLRCNGVVRIPKGSTTGGATVAGLSWADGAAATGKPDDGE